MYIHSIIYSPFTRKKENVSAKPHRTNTLRPIVTAPGERCWMVDGRYQYDCLPELQCCGSMCTLLYTYCIGVPGTTFSCLLCCRCLCITKVSGWLTNTAARSRNDGRRSIPRPRPTPRPPPQPRPPPPPRPPQPWWLEVRLILWHRLKSDSFRALAPG